MHVLVALISREAGFKLPGQGLVICDCINVIYVHTCIYDFAERSVDGNAFTNMSREDLLLFVMASNTVCIDELSDRTI